MNFGKTFLACLLAIVAGSIVSFIFTIIVAVSLISSISFLEQKTYSIDTQSVLVIDLSEPIVEYAPASFVDNFDLGTFKVKKHISIYDAVAMVDAAAVDPRIKGLYIKVTPVVSSSLSSLYELRDAIKRFNDAAGDKFIVAYGDTYSQGALYLASVADVIYLNPMGAVDWSGMSATSMFFKGTLDKLGVEPEIIRHGKFKGAVEPFMLTKMSDENRLQMEQMLGSVWGNMVGNIAEARTLSADTLQRLASDLAILTAADAQKAGLVDSLAYRDELIAALERLTGDKKPNLITMNQYRQSGVNLNGDLMSKDQVAVIYASGDIVDMGNPDSQIVGNSLAAKIREIRQNDDVKAVVLRVNSPGGSALASEVVRREVELTKAVKPVVVSMGAYAASGGYWISCPADEIVVAPSTITGSIGVFGLMFNAEKGAREQLGLTFDVVKTNQSADMGTPFRPLTRAERLAMQNSVDTTYNMFLKNVSIGRSMTTAQVDSVGQGRVWSGLQAIDNGLANRIGGLNDAIMLAGEKAGISTFRIVSVTDQDQDSFASLFSQFSNAALQWVFGSKSDEARRVSEQIQSLTEQQGVRAAMEYNLSLDL